MINTADLNLNNRTVVEQPKLPGFGLGTDTIIFALANIADEFPTWGTYGWARDRMLREFVPQEPMLAGTMYQTSGKYASFGYTLEGPLKQIHFMHSVLQQSEHGMGWIPFWLRTLQDYFGQDNGAFPEIVKATTDEATPTVQINHLDSAKCRRTGRWDEPVIYRDINGQDHTLKYWQVIDLTEMPSPKQEHRGLQLCAVSRVLAQAQELRDISIYNREKLGGRNPRSIHLVAGVQQRSIDDTIKLLQTQAANMGLQRYITPPIVASVEPLARVTHEQIDFASLPDGFNKEESMRWYVDYLALCFGIDPQDLAPLPGGNLGTAQQSQVLAQKARGKGAALFMRNVEHQFNHHGVMPRTVTFKFGEQDSAENELKTQLKWRRAQMYKLYFDVGVPKDVLFRMMNDEGDLADEYLEVLGITDLTPKVRIDSGYKQYLIERGDYARISWPSQTEQRIKAEPRFF